MSASPHTIYDELKILAIKMGVSKENLDKTHNIKDLLRAMTAHLDGPTNAVNIADGVKNYTEVYAASADD